MLLEVKNFKAWPSATIDFDTLDNYTLVWGKTGSGKTSLFIDALTCALYNRTPRDGANAIISSTRGNGLVRLEFEIGDDSYEIIRSAEGGKGAATFSCNGTPVTTKVAEADEEIERLIGPYPLFMSTNIKAQLTPGEFFNSAQPEQKQFIMDLLGLSSYITAYDQIRGDLKQKQTELKTLESGLEDELQELEELNQWFIQNPAPGDNTPLQELITNKKETEKNINREVAEATSNLSLAKTIDGLPQRITEASDTLLALRTEWAGVDQVAFGRWNTYQNNKAQIQLKETELEREVSNLSSEIARLGAYTNVAVPCAQELFSACPLAQSMRDTSSQIQALQVALDAKNEALTKHRVAKTTMLGMILSDQEANRIQLLQTNLAQAETNYTYLYEMLEKYGGVQLAKTAGQFESELQTALQSQASIAIEIANLENNYAASLRAEMEYKSKEEALEKEKERITKIETKKANAVEEIALLNNTAKLAAPSGFPAYISKDILPQVLEFVNEYLPEHMNIDIDLEAKKIITITNNGLDLKFSELSGGEMFLVSLAFMLGVRRFYNSPIPIIIIDEGFGTIDSDNLDMVLDNLDDAVSQHGLKLMLLTHVADLKDRITTLEVEDMKFIG